jgi:DNA-binding transcriptional MerR regulator
MDIARAARVSPATVRKMADSGQIKHVQRDYNDWRVYTVEAIKEVQILAGTIKKENY